MKFNRRDFLKAAGFSLMAAGIGIKWNKKPTSDTGAREDSSQSQSKSIVMPKVYCWNADGVSTHYGIHELGVIDTNTVFVWIDGMSVRTELSTYGGETLWAIFEKPPQVGSHIVIYADVTYA